MNRIWTRTRRYMTILWIGTIILEIGVFTLASRINNSWLLLLGVALLLIPLAAMDRTWAWFGREPRKRWKRHDVEPALAAGAGTPGSVPSAPGDGQRSTAEEEAAGADRLRTYRAEVQAELASVRKPGAP